MEYRGPPNLSRLRRDTTPEDPFDETSGIGRGRRLLFQEVPERKSGKNRFTSTSTVSPGPR